MTENERNQVIAEKLQEGMSLSDVQKLLDAEYGIKMTYLELRLLAADLSVDWSRLDEQKEEEQSDAPEDIDLSKEPESESATRVSVSKLVRPGAAMSGDVTFASGAEAEWFIDASGRLGLNPKSGSSQPTQDDIREFQIELQKKLSGSAG